MIRSVPDQEWDLGLAPVVLPLQSENVARVLRIHHFGNFNFEHPGVGDKWTRMAKETPSAPILWKMAALMDLCPADVQDVVYQTIDDVHENYGSNRRFFRGSPTRLQLRNGAVPVDIGRVGEEDSTGRVAEAGEHASCECPSDRAPRAAKRKAR